MSQDRKTKIRFHGKEWDIPTEWSLNVQSVGEAMRAIEVNTKKLYRNLYENDKKGIRYCVVINGENFVSEKPLETIGDIMESELAIRKRKLETLDIVPVVEGADSDILGIVTTILGIALIIVGAVLSLTGNAGIGVPLIFAGLSLTAAGAAALLSKPPTFEDFREIEQGGKTSYLFSGPQNIIGEGGPVPVAYGQLIVGSQVVSAAYVIQDFDVDDTSKILGSEYENLTQVPIEPPQKNTWVGESGPYNSTQTNDPCCFIFIQGEGDLTMAVRHYRDKNYGHDSSVANGYRRMAKWIVPLMKKNFFIQNLIKYSMTTPLSKYAEWSIGQNKYGWIFWPFKFWTIIWRMLGLILKGEK